MSNIKTIINVEKIRLFYVTFLLLFMDIFLGLFLADIALSSKNLLIGLVLGPITIAASVFANTLIAKRFLGDKSLALFLSFSCGILSLGAFYSLSGLITQKLATGVMVISFLIALVLSLLLILITILIGKIKAKSNSSSVGVIIFTVVGLMAISLVGSSYGGSAMFLKQRQSEILSFSTPIYSPAIQNVRDVSIQNSQNGEPGFRIDTSDLGMYSEYQDTNEYNPDAVCLETKPVGGAERDIYERCVLLDQTVMGSPIYINKRTNSLYTKVGNTLIVVYAYGEPLEDLVGPLQTIQLADKIVLLDISNRNSHIK
jgi:hypothetical protein